MAYHRGDLPVALRAATTELVAERGPRGFSLREVARRAGVSHAAPAHHFGSARGLLTAVATEGFGHLAAALAEAIEASTDPVEQLRGCGRAYIRTALDYPGHYAVMFAGDLHDKSDESLQTAGSAAHALLVDTIVRIRDDLNPDLDVDTAASLAWSSMAGLVVVAPSFSALPDRPGAPQVPIDELVTAFTDLLVVGFLPRRHRAVGDGSSQSRRSGQPGDTMVGTESAE